ncbi:MAG: coenzyme F420 hydrogenase [Parcubacteria group bacterium GW2011_GWC2_45_15]|nr:MAG: coenzyme F420 hydrogenase [Parcubacteria group bacterium GW2011_GWC2_45_15]OGY93505.1 MAG: hypothetical protein A3J95_02885 [Candidatus Komeilibacteria bacterium RIFOXYC2_FULL_45_12]
MDFWWSKLQREILQTDLYTRSGTAVGLSDGILTLAEKDGDYFPLKVKDGDIPKEAFTCSPDRYNNMPALNRLTFGKLPSNWLFGEVKKYYLGYAKDPAIRRLGSSGGVLTAVLLYLLEHQLIDGAVAVRMRSDKPYLGEPFIATSREQIIAAAQSKYSIVPVNQILSELPGPYCSLAYVGLPDQVMAIRKLQQIAHAKVSRINYVLGPFCGLVLHFSAIVSFLRSHGVRDLALVKSLEYRAGEWPGYLRITLTDGRIIQARKFHANYLIPFHLTRYSLYQVDQTNELTDISVGDAWAPSYEQRGQGWSLVLARSVKGRELLHTMIDQGYLNLREISFNEALAMQSHGIDFKKRGAFIRIAKLKRQGKPYPDYGYEPTNIPAGRLRFEAVLGVLFRLCGLKIFLAVVEKLPVRLSGGLFVVARNFWRRRTKKIKRGGLTDLKFRLTGK